MEIFREAVIGRRNVFGSLRHGVPKRKISLESSILCNRIVHFSSGVWYSWKHLFFELDVVGQVYCGNGLPCKGPFRGGEKMGESTGQRLPGKHQQFEGGEF